MKKAAALFLTLAMLLTITGCSLTVVDQSKGESAKDPPAAAQPQEPASPEKPAVPETPDEPSQGEEPSIPAPEGSTEEAGTDGTDAAPVIRTSHTDVTLFSAGETFRFTVWNSDGKEPDTCTYTSSDPEVAAVDEGGGEVTAVAPGTATITAHVDFGGEEQDLACIVRCKWEGAEAPEDTAGTEPSQPASGTAETPSLSDFFTTLQGQYEGLGSMMAMEGELLENYYPGLSGIAAVEEIYLQETMITVANVAVGLVKLSDGATSDDVAAVQNILQARIDTQANGGAWYPASCETWENGVITSTSNVVGMFVYPDEAQAMADLFTETFSS